MFKSFSVALPVRGSCFCSAFILQRASTAFYLARGKIWLNFIVYSDSFEFLSYVVDAVFAVLCLLENSIFLLWMTLCNISVLFVLVIGRFGSVINVSPVLLCRRISRMGRAIGQKHFYCTPAVLPDTSYLIYERRDESKGIDGGFVYSARSCYYAYRLRNLLEKMYRVGAYDKLKRWRLVYGGKHPSTHDIYLDAFAFARQLLAEFTPDDSKVLSASIIGVPNG